MVAVHPAAGVPLPVLHHGDPGQPARRAGTSPVPARSTLYGSCGGVPDSFVSLEDTMTRLIGVLLLLLSFLCASPAYPVDLAAFRGLTAPGLWEVSRTDGSPIHHSYRVWGGSAPVSGDIGDPAAQGYVLLGRSHKSGSFSGNYSYYLIQTPGGYIAYVDAVQGSNGSYFGVATSLHSRCVSNVGGAPDGASCIVGGSNAGYLPGYILINASGQGLSGITVYTDDDRSNYNATGRAIISLGDYVLESWFDYNAGTDTWTADNSMIFKIDTNFIYVCGGYDHVNGVLESTPSMRCKMKRNMSQGETVTLMAGDLVVSWTLRATGKTVEITGGTVGNAIILQESLTGAMDPSQAYYIYSPDGHLLRSHDLSLGLYEDSVMYRSFRLDSYFVASNTQTGTALTGAPFYSLVSSVTTQVNAVLGQLPSQVASPVSGVKAVVIPLY